MDSLSIVCGFDCSDFNIDVFVWTFKLPLSKAQLTVSSGIVHLVIVNLSGDNFLYGQLQPPQTLLDRSHASKIATPIPCHSHNDYERKHPLFDALSAGCTSVEADIWSLPKSTELYVGHRKNSLSDDRTLKKLYLSPLEDLLDVA